MAQILIVRHGQTAWNAVERFRGRTEIELDEVGLKQAELTGERVAEYPVTALYCSPLRRAVDTAAPIARRLNIEAVPLEGINDLDFDLLHTCRALHIGSLSLGAEPARSATHAAVQMVRAGGGLVSFDVNYRPSLWPSAARALEQIRTILPRVDLIKVNEEEAQLLTGSDNPEKAGMALLQSGPAMVILTHGARGSYFFTRADSGFSPAFSVEAVDATGCGDSFMGGLLNRLTLQTDWHSQLSSDTLRSAFRFASAVGALTATRTGAIPAMPYLAEVETFLDQYIS